MILQLCGQMPHWLQYCYSTNDCGGAFVIRLHLISLISGQSCKKLSRIFFAPIQTRPINKFTASNYFFPPPFTGASYTLAINNYKFTASNYQHCWELPNTLPVLRSMSLILNIPNHLLRCVHVSRKCYIRVNAKSCIFHWQIERCGESSHFFLQSDIG